MESNYQILLQKIDAFIRKYYKNQLIKGFIFFVTAFLSSYILIATLEYFGRYNTQIRFVIFFSFTAFTLYSLIKYVIIPIAGIYKLRKVISHEQASIIIGKHFSKINDALLNTIQLRNEANQNKEDNSLLIAAIEQKTAQLTPIPFQSAINLKANLKYLKFAALPVIIIILLSFINPEILSDGGKRILKFNTKFEPQAPFTFTIENNDLTSEQFADFDLKVKVSGKIIPNEVNIQIDGNVFKLHKVNKTQFTYAFKNIQKTTEFNLQADEFSSQKFTLHVLSKPLILAYQVKCNYPLYTGRKSETLNNPTDLTVPIGTQLTWQFTSKQTSKIELGFDSKVAQASVLDQNHFTFFKKVFVSQNYYIKNSNETQAKGDSLNYNLNVIPDSHPSISIEEKSDSILGKQMYFIGDAADDYGLSKLTFNYTFVKTERAEKLNKKVTKTIPLDKTQNPFRFNYYINLSQENIEPGDEVAIYFELWDNDGVFGAKSVKSRSILHKEATLNELSEQHDKSADALKEKMEDALKEAKSLQKDLKLLQLKMQEKRELTWEEKRKAESILKQQDELTKKINELNKEFKLNNQREQEYRKETESILEKQQQIEKMYNELLNDEMKQLIKKVEDMMKLQNKDQLKQEMENLQLNNKDVEKELDKMLEMFKELELEKKMDQLVSKLDELSKKQSELEKQNDSKNGKPEEQKQKQDALNKEFNELRKDLKELEKQNNELENKKELADTKQEEESIEKDMQESSDQLKEGNQKKAKENQKQAAEKMEKMAEKIKKQKEDEEAEQAEIDIKALREILENLIELSKQQEGLMEKFKDVNGYNPQFVSMGQEQMFLKNSAKIIDDSLTALGKRVKEIGSFVDKEVSKLNNQLERANTNFSQRNIPQIKISQQTAMSHMNNLAVMLSDVLKQMQDEKQGEEEKEGKKGGKPKSGKGKGKGKGSGKKSMGQLKKMQEELNKQLRDGQNKNGTEKGNKPGGMGSEQYARMAAQQMAIRQQLQKMISQMDAKEKEEMGGSGKLAELQKQMEKTEKELFNKRLSQETINRQQDILTRMLESEKAEKKQEQDKKREAEQSKEKNAVAPPPLFNDYINKKNKETDLLKTIPSELVPYYKNKANQYLKNQ